ncbi:MAG: 6-bladed beta-propeller [Tannerella sp.]|nr:6-bladed beta-propeller [Tannerella sp.]
MNKFSCVLLIILTLNCLLILGCKKNTKEEKQSKTIELLPTKSGQIKLSQIFSKAEVLNFNTNDIVYTKPKKLLVKNNRFYLLSKNAIIVFDITGNLVLYLSKIGIGPGEYIEISDFLVEDNDNILINDSQGRKMIRYDSQGEFIKAIRHDLVSFNLFKINDEIYLNSGHYINPQSGYRVNVWNEKNSSIDQKYLKQEQTVAYLSVLEYTNFSFFKDTLSFSHSFSNIVYQLENNEEKPRLRIDFGKHNLPKNFTKNHTNLNLFMENLWSSSYASRIDGYREGNSFLFFAYTFQAKRPFFWLSKIDNKQFHFDKFEDDFLFPGVIQKTGYDCLPIFIDEKYLYIAIEAYRFIELFEESRIMNDGNFEYQHLLANIIKQIDAESNALVIRYEIK